MYLMPSLLLIFLMFQRRIGFEDFNMKWFFVLLLAQLGDRVCREVTFNNGDADDEDN